MVSVQVANGSDDVEEQNGQVNLNSGDLEMAENKNAPQQVGIRFSGLHIPAGATIVEAHIEFVADSNQSDSAALVIVAEAAGNSATFSGSNNLSQRSFTNARVDWGGIAAWSAGQLYQTPDLAPVVQELVNRSDWNSGNAATFMISGRGKRAAKSYNNSSSQAPRLVVEFVIE